MMRVVPQEYRKKPVVITASQWFEHGDHEKVERPWSKQSDHRCEHCKRAWGEHGVIRTLEDSQNGGHFVCPADWIICGVKGEYYACKPDIFQATYELAAAPAASGDELVARLNALVAEVDSGIIMRHGDGNAYLLRCALKDAAAALCARSEVIEQCAKLVESFSDGHTACRDAMDVLQVHRIPIGHAATNCPNYIAERIRALK